MFYLSRRLKIWFKIFEIYSTYFILTTMCPEIRKP